MCHHSVWKKPPSYGKVIPATNGANVALLCDGTDQTTIPYSDPTDRPQSPLFLVSGTSVNRFLSAVQLAWGTFPAYLFFGHVL
jgi:hypothetical protein